MSSRDELVKAMAQAIAADIEAAGWCMVLKEPMEAVLRLACELCDAVDAEGDDVGGHRGSLTILRELGLAVRALSASPLASPKADRPALDTTEVGAQA